MIPVLYLLGVSTGDFSEALEALLGEQAKGFSANTVVRLKEKWTAEHQEWSRRSFAGKRYVYIWVDGIHVNVRLEDTENKRQCILVVMGATPEGKKELIAVQDGYRESEQSWRELLLDLKQRGLEQPPELAIGDGALGFWAALRKIYPGTGEQRCWVHKTANILNDIPKSTQPRVKQALQEIWEADTQEQAQQALNQFKEKYEAKYPKAWERLQKDSDVLLSFYDFPAEHWRHIRTTNPIESTFATIRLRHRRTNVTDVGNESDNARAPIHLSEQERKEGQEESGGEKSPRLKSCVPIPSSLDHPPFPAAWSEWLAYRKGRRLYLREPTIRRQLDALLPLGPDKAAECVELSIRQGWQGIFPEKLKPKRSEAFEAAQRYLEMEGVE